MSINHVGIFCKDYHASEQFYTKALAKLVDRLHVELGDDNKKACGFGKSFPSFWIAGDAMPNGTNPQATASGVRVALSAKTQKQVQEWYDECIKNGGKDNGAPGYRPQYHKFYYSAFIIDADSNNIEAVCHFDVTLYYKYIIPVAVGAFGTAGYFC
jgi:catechol 2,3-dioxygenase-like lactoylglutathione lyase family enzyme